MLSFISTTTVFGTPLDVTLAELAIEAFFPADDATTRKLTATLGQQKKAPSRRKFFLAIFSTLIALCPIQRCDFAMPWRHSIQH